MTNPHDIPKPWLCFPSLENNHWEHSEHLRMDSRSSVLPSVIRLLIKISPFQTHLPSHRLLVSWLLTRGSLSALSQCWAMSSETSGMEVEAGLCTESYFGQVLQLFCKTKFHPPPEQPLWLLWLLYRWDLEKTTCSLFLPPRCLRTPEGQGGDNKTITQSGTGDPAHPEHHRMLLLSLVIGSCRELHSSTP